LLQQDAAAAVCSKLFMAFPSSCEAQQDQSRPNTFGILAAGFLMHSCANEASNETISLLLQNLQADPQMQDAAGWDA